MYTYNRVYYDNRTRIIVYQNQGASSNNELVITIGNYMELKTKIISESETTKASSNNE